LEDLRELFGVAVANIVDGVTKFDALIPEVAAPPAQEGKQNGTFQGEEAASQQLQDDEQSTLQAGELKRRQRSETVRKMLLAMA
jgi:GTP pyrophosphokinase